MNHKERQSEKAIHFTNSPMGIHKSETVLLHTAHLRPMQCSVPTSISGIHRSHALKQLSSCLPRMCKTAAPSRYQHGSLNVPIEHHPTIRYMVYNGTIPKMGQLPTPDQSYSNLLFVKLVATREALKPRRRTVGKPLLDVSSQASDT